MFQQLYTCGADAELIFSYLEDRFHPVHLGDVYRDGRYRIIHKLGAGAYSTVWAARDQVLEHNVALKVVAADSSATTRELEVLQKCQEHSSHDIRSQYVTQMLDNFVVSGPNGVHKFIVYELLGPSILSLLDRIYFPDDRLPANIAKRVSYEALLGLGFLHELGIGHGDIHTNNLAFSMPQLASMSEQELMDFFGKPRTSEVKRTDGKALEQIVPRYIVWPACPPLDRSICQNHIKLIDFGESFTPVCRPDRLHTPLSVCPPELIFKDRWDHRVDLWSVGCAIFELITGRTPFGGILLTEPELISQLIGSIGPLPEKWKARWEDMYKQDWELSSPQSLQSRLEHAYSTQDGPPELKPSSLRALRRMLQRLLRFEPTARDPIANILRDAWYQEDLDNDSGIGMGSSDGDSTDEHGSSANSSPLSENFASQDRALLEPELGPSEMEQPVADTSPNPTEAGPAEAELRLENSTSSPPEPAPAEVEQPYEEGTSSPSEQDPTPTEQPLAETKSSTPEPSLTDTEQSSAESDLSWEDLQALGQEVQQASGSMDEASTGESRWWSWAYSWLQILTITRNS